MKFAAAARKSFLTPKLKSNFGSFCPFPKGKSETVFSQLVSSLKIQVKVDVFGGLPRYTPDGW